MGRMEIARLRAEHRAVQDVLMLIDDALETRGEAAWLAAEIGRALEFLARELPRHIEDEEAGLFAWAAGDPAACMVLPSLRCDHTALLRMIGEGLRLLAQQRVEAAADIAGAVSRLLHQHIATEERELLSRLLHGMGDQSAWSGVRAVGVSAA